MDILIYGNENIIQSITSYALEKPKIDSEASYNAYMQKEPLSWNINMGLKHSFYNYVVSNDDRFLIYNTLYNTLVSMDKAEYEKFSDIKALDEATKKECVVYGLLVPQTVDEVAAYIAWAELKRIYEHRMLGITLATTTACNARCAYCFENGICQKPFDRVAQGKIIDFCKKHMDPDLGVRIVWFGGEPLMNVKFIREVVADLKENDIKFISYMITNGSLLDLAGMEEKITKWHLNGIQVTVDGTQEKYESIKNYYNKEIGNYYRILFNIKQIAEKYSDFQIDIRLNLDTENIDDIEKALSELELIFGQYDNVRIYAAFLDCVPNSVPKNMRKDVLKRFLRKMDNPGKLAAANYMHNGARFAPCDIADRYSFSMDVDGNVYACEREIGRAQQALGNITDASFKDHSRDGEYCLREECKNCIFLPKCFGGCEANFVEGELPCVSETFAIPAYLEFMLE